MKKNLKILTSVILSTVGVTAVSLQMGRTSRITEPQEPGKPTAYVASLGQSLPITPPELVQSAPAFADIGNLEKGTNIELPLPDGSRRAAHLNYVNTYANGATAAGGSLTDGTGIFQIAEEPWGYRGFILQRSKKIAYVYSSDADGNLQVATRPIGEVICEPDPNWKPVAQADVGDVENAAIYNDGRSVGIINEAIPILHSLPRAKATIYLDFDGEVIEGQSWEGGARIVAPAYNLSAAEVTDMWRKVAEDYAPFEVNVTTDLQAYLRAPLGARMRCITTSNQFAAAGGIAFGSTFRESGDTCCWNFYTGNAGVAVISHEIGHTVGLHHDGQGGAGYYGGHGSGSTSWGPIMGAPYGVSVTHWSKGDYVDANEQQDDLVAMGSFIPRRLDDHADNADSATPLVIGSGGGISNSGIIDSPLDIDAFTFTTSGGTVSLQFDPAPSSPNLDIEAKLYNSSGTLLTTASPQNQLSATLSRTVSAGTYTVTVDGVGNATWQTNGYDDYGSLGEFSISGTVPSMSLTLQTQVNALNGTALGVVAQGNGSGYAIISGNTGSAFAINSTTGLISVANAGAIATPGNFNLTVSYVGTGSPATVPVNVLPLSGLKQEIWTGVGGSGIGSLRSHPTYPNNPNSTLRAPLFETTFPADNYGQKLSGYLLPTETGPYTFWTCADDSSELWLSTNNDPANKVLIASNGSAAQAEEWTKFSSQQSSSISLTAGQIYYIELLHREQTGNDQLSVAWQTPSKARHLIPTENLQYPGTYANIAPWIASRTYRVREDRNPGSMIATIEAGDSEPGSVLSNFTIIGGNIGNAFSLNPTTGVLSVNAPLSHAGRNHYYLDVRTTDSGGLTSSAQIAVEVEALAVKRQVWTGVGGNDINNLTALNSYPDVPNSTTYISFFETPTNSAENYGQRLTGYLRAPDSGQFTFWIASDDDGELWLSSDTDPANKTRIAYVDGSTGSREWGRFASQRSTPVTLESGRFYFIEVLHKEGIGGDNLAVSWSGPDFGQVMLGAPHVTQDFYNHGAPVLNDENVTVFDRDQYVTTLVAKDWADPGSTVTYSITGGNADGAFMIDPLTGELRGSGGRLPVGNRTLTVTATDNSPNPLSDTASIHVNVVAAGLKREVWTGLDGGQGLGGLTGSLYYPQSPSEVNYAGDFKAPSGYGDNYGQRLSGFLIPPTSGNYTFWIASDDSSELWLSTDATVPNKSRIATVNGAVGEQQWDGQSNQQSIVIPLVGGQPYYIEALQKEGAGGDHLAVAWQGPGFGRTLITANYLLYPDTYRTALKREVWAGNSTLAPPATPPTSTGTIFSFKGPSEVAENFSERVSGYLIPPVTGDYSFWLSCDDDGELFLSSDEDPANAVSVATVTGYTDPEQWEKFPSQHSATVRLVAGLRYYIEVHHRDGNFGDHMAVAWDGPGITRTIIANEHLEHPDTPANRSLLKYEVWNDLTGDFLPDLTGSPAFPTTPSTTATLPDGTGLVTPTNVADNFGDRITGYLVAPEHGRYTFWIASDNSSELWISSDSNPANARKIAGVDNVVGPQDWDAQAGQKSAPIALEAGQRYFLQILHKEGIGGDHLAVAWQGPTFSRRIIPNPYLEHPDSIPGSPTLKREVWNGINGVNVSDLTAAASFQNGTPSSRGVLTSFEAPAGQGDNYGQRMTAILIAPESGNYRFWIAADDGSGLWLSTDDNPANRMEIANTPAATNPREWEKFSSQGSGSLPLIAGHRYHIEALHKEGASIDHVAVAWEGPSFSRRIIDGRFLEYPGELNGAVALKREIWTGIGGNNVSDLTNDPEYPSAPDRTEALTLFETPVNEADNYGQKVSGYLIAPRTGDYKFWIASDDGGEFWLAANGDPASKVRICFTNGATGLENWTNNANQESATISLTAGQRCYIEALHKEGGGDDYLSVAWQGPGFGLRIIEPEFLEYPGLPPAEGQSGAIIPVSGVNPGYTFWTDYVGLEGNDRLTSADPDGDGLPNSLEFVLGGQPNDVNSDALSLMPTLSVDPTWASFEFRLADVARSSGPFVEYGSTLFSWDPAAENAGMQVETIDDDFGPGIDRVTVRLPRGPDVQFLRLNSNQP